MTAEQLNIKLRLDTSEITAGVQKVKTQLTGMTNTVKQSVPQISKEGKKAGNALGSVATASNKVKKSLDSIGDEAKDSLGKVTKYANQATNSLKNVKGGNIKFNLDGKNTSKNIEETTGSLEGLQGTMQAIMGLQFVQVFEKLKKPFVNTKKLLADTDAAITKSIKSIGESIKSIIYMKKIPSNRGGQLIPLAITQGYKSIGQELKNIAKSAWTAGKAIGNLTIKALALGTAFAAAGGIAIAKASKEYNEAQAKLLSAYQAAGAGAEEATQAYRGMFRFLGDQSKAVEAANHLAKLTTNTEELAEWTKIAQGIYATFGDSLPIEGLTEAANETARVGKVTGTMADALNWAGISEDAFNNQLAQTNTLAEREALIRNTLNGLYSTAAENYERNNKATIRQNEAMARLQSTMGKIGKTVTPLITSLTNLANTILTTLAQPIAWASALFSVLADMISNVAKALGALFGVKYESELSDGLSSATGSLEGASGFAGDLENSLSGAKDQALALKRAVMGFDELNVLSNPDTSSSSDTGYTGGGSTGGGYTGGNTTGVIDQITDKAEELKAKLQESLQDVIDRFGGKIAIIASLLGGLKLTDLLKDLGKAVGLGDNFLSQMDKIKGYATSAITIVLQYTLVQEFMESFLDSGELKDYIYGTLAAALGTGILYYQWGTKGLVIGLAVTAVVSLKTAFEAEDADTMDRAVVATTGLVSALGAIGLAWKTFNLGGVFAGIGTFLGSIGTALGASGAGAIAVGGGIIAAAITAIVSVVIYLKRNWDDITEAFKNFFKENIAPKLEKIKEKLEELIPPKVFEKIKEFIGSFENIGDVFEVIGEVIFNVLAGVVGGAISAALGWIKGLVEAIGGLKDFVSGFVGAIIALFKGDMPKVKEEVTKAFNGIKSFLSGWYNTTLGLIINFVKGVGDWFAQLYPKFEQFWTKVKNLFSKVGTAISDAIVGAVKGAINAVLRNVVNKINTFIGWINGAVSLINKIPNVNISKITPLEVPQLAKGGITTGSTLANIGEHGREAVLPLENNTGWMDVLADRIANRNQTPSKIVLMVDGKELGWAAINNINGITKQTGGLQLCLI